MSKSTKISINNKNISSRPKINEKAEIKKDSRNLQSNIRKALKEEASQKLKIKNEEKETTTTTTTTRSRGPVKTKSKISTITATTKPVKPITEKKIKTSTLLQKSKNSDIKSQPLRAKYTPEIVNSLKNSQNRFTNMNKNNVMTFVHNVTVLSPPLRRKQTTTAVNNPTTTTSNPERKLNKTLQNDQNDSRSRTRTRTLDPDEIIVLKKTSVDNKEPKSLDRTAESKIEKPNQDEETSKYIVKEAIAYEINFDDKIKTKEKLEMASKPGPSSKIATEKNEGSEDYEDDFESYESDFETGSSSAEVSELKTTQSTENDENTEIESVESENSKASDDDCDDTEEETQPPITIIHKEKDDERKLDSGNYDMHSRREKLQQNQQQQTQQQQLDSIDTITGNSEQLDSGISYNGNTPQPSVSSPSKLSATTTASSTVHFYNSGTLHSLNIEKISKFTKRGQELMKKIQLDEITYTLFDLKPMTYENYMKIYGNINASQATTQTNDNQMNANIQTNEFQYRSIWTQHPPQYDLNFIKKRNLRNLQNFCGEFENYDDEDDKDKENDTCNPELLQKNNNALDKSLKALQKFRYNELKRTQANQKPINFDRLNEFLNETSFTISGILNKINHNRKMQNSKDLTNISRGYFTLNINFLNALKVIKIFSNTNLNLILTIHESIDGIYKCEFSNLISVWTLTDFEKPLRLLSTWNEVCRADICSENSDIIVCGLRDGSIAMWDLRETYSFCSKLDGYLKHFPPTQSIAPIFNINEMKITDLGAVVDIKSFRKSNGLYNIKTYKPIQMVSLNDTGILTVWTLIETGNSATFPSKPHNKRTKHTKIEYNSPWSRVKLIQSEICDLREYLNLKPIRIKSAFEKTKSYFENDLFNDDALRELQETQNDIKLGLQGLRFTNLDTGMERIFIGTNRNYIITCTKTLHTDQIHKIIFDETKFLFSTTFRLLKSEKYLVVGLSNGSVVAINCNLNKLKDKKRMNNNTDIDDQNSLTKHNNLEYEHAEYGKTCAIQNIIRNERKSLRGTSGKFDSIQNSFDEQNAIGMEKFEDEDYFYIFDQQILLDGSILRKNLVQNMEISSDGKKLFVLSDGKLRKYDFMTGKEQSSITEKTDSNQINILGLALAKNISSNQNQIILMKNNEVQVHLIK